MLCSTSWYGPPWPWAETPCRYTAWKCQTRPSVERSNVTLTDLLEDAQVGEGSRNVQLDLLQTRLPIRRASVWKCVKLNDTGWRRRARRRAIASASRTNLQIQARTKAPTSSSTFLLLLPDRCCTALFRTQCRRQWAGFELWAVTTMTGLKPL